VGTDDLHPLGEYQPLDVLGQGGMGTVLLARHTLLGHTVAIKVLRAEDSDEPGRAGRLLREAQVLLRLCHPGLVRYLHLGTADGKPYLVMEHVSGTSLRAHLRRGPLPIPLALSLARQVAEAMAHAHQQGVLHRDLKPENILLSASPDAPPDAPVQARVVDFGIARSLSGKPPVQGPITEVQTAETTLLGTPAYMAPEQARGAPLTDRADVYALGTVLFEALCGRPPFVADSDVVLLGLHQVAPPPPLKTLLPGAPPALSALVAQMLDKDPAARPSMKEAAARLSALSAPAPLRSVRRRPLLLMGVIGIALLALTPLALRKRPSPRPPAPALVLLQAVHVPIGAREVREALDLPADTPDPPQVDLAPLRLPLRDADGLDFTAASRLLEARFAQEVRPLLQGQGRRVVYLGMAPVPLSIQLGALLGPLHEVEVYQQHHGSHSWRWPGRGAAPAIRVSGLPAVNDPAGAGEAVVRVSVSARIDPLDTRAVVPRALAEVDVALERPEMDALRAPQDVEAVAQAFAQALWDLSGRLPALRRIHLFAAVPPALALRLGMVLQPNIHPPVQTYQYRRGGSPRYQAALLLNR
jgi:tRNA A-37 threonylcarbamoyl transferase component Bud32